MKKYAVAIILVAVIAIVALWVGGTRKASAPATSTAPVVGVGAHCGGFIKDAPTCASGYHCQLKISSPDTGGICVAD